MTDDIMVGHYQNQPTWHTATGDTKKGYWPVCQAWSEASRGRLHVVRHLGPNTKPLCGNAACVVTREGLQVNERTN